MKRSKLRLRPWAKVALIFVAGVILVSQIFKLTGSEASWEHKVIHGVITLNNNGDTYIKQIDGAFDQEIILKTKEDYRPFEIVTVVLDGGNVENDYLTYGKELDSVEKKYNQTISEYRKSIADTIYK